MDKEKIINKIGLVGDVDQEWLYLMNLTSEELDILEVNSGKN
jgi:hypothetical protein